MSERTIVNAFTVDVEEYFHASAFKDVISKSDWLSLPSSVERCTDTMLELLNETGQCGTFFVLGWIAERFPTLVRRIHEAGNEIASHGYEHDLVYEQSRIQFKEESHRAKSLLEDLTGQEVLGYRAATFSINHETPWAHDVLIDLGFAYDSSVFPIRHDRYGDPNAPRFPFRIKHTQQDTSLVEFPLSTWKFSGMHLPVSGGGYFRLLPSRVTKHGLRTINKQEGHPFIFYVHPWEIDSQQPRLDVNLATRIRHYTNLHRCEERLRGLLRDFRFSSCRDVLTNLGWISDSPKADVGARVATG